MLIDWFTVSAQIFNFLLLVWLLKRFLYQPILQALDAREQKIAAELAQAAYEKQAAEIQREEFVKKNQDFEQQRSDLFKQAISEASLERQRLLEQVRNELEAVRVQQQAALSSEQHSLQMEIHRRTQEEVFAIARKTLLDLADVKLEAAIIAQFIHRLQGLSAEQKALLVVFNDSATPALIRTCFELSAKQINEIEQAIEQTLGIKTAIQFETSTALISGIELCSHGQKIAWSIADYLASLEKKLGEILPVG
jgi:F-type H+-transporting ATPase subunit b